MSNSGETHDELPSNLEASIDWDARSAGDRTLADEKPITSTAPLAKTTDGHSQGAATAKQLPQDSGGSAFPALLTHRHQQAAGWITFACMVVLGTSWALEFRRRGRPINIDRPYETRSTELQIDLNSAEWPELTLLPKVSETMARRIVAHRVARGRFDSVHQIQEVKGIGPLTFSRIQPMLSPIPTAASKNDATETEETLLNAVPTPP